MDAIGIENFSSRKKDHTFLDTSIDYSEEPIDLVSTLAITPLTNVSKYIESSSSTSHRLWEVSPKNTISLTSILDLFIYSLIQPKNSKDTPVLLYGKPREKNKPLVDQLPQEIFDKIFSYLDFQTLKRSKLVSREWKKRCTSLQVFIERTTYINKVPHEIFCKIFSYLNFKTMNTAKKVCIPWKNKSIRIKSFVVQKIKAKLSSESKSRPIDRRSLHLQGHRIQHLINCELALDYHHFPPYVGHLKSVDLETESVSLRESVSISDPLDTSSRLNIAGFVSEFRWNQNPIDPMELIILLPRENVFHFERMNFKEAFPYAISLDFTIYRYDPTNRLYYSAVSTDTPPFKGGVVEVNIGDEITPEDNPFVSFTQVQLTISPATPVATDKTSIERILGLSPREGSQYMNFSHSPHEHVLRRFGNPEINTSGITSKDIAEWISKTPRLATVSKSFMAKAKKS